MIYSIPLEDSKTRIECQNLIGNFYNVCFMLRGKASKLHSDYALEKIDSLEKMLIELFKKFLSGANIGVNRISFLSVPEIPVITGCSKNKLDFYECINNLKTFLESFIEKHAEKELSENDYCRKFNFDIWEEPYISKYENFQKNRKELKPLTYYELCEILDKDPEAFRGEYKKDLCLYDLVNQVYQPKEAFSLFCKITGKNFLPEEKKDELIKSNLDICENREKLSEMITNFSSGLDYLENFYRVYVESVLDAA